MIAIIVTACRECPFSIRDQLPWLCTMDRRAIERTVAPPEWCPLREADRLVTLRVK